MPDPDVFRLHRHLGILHPAEPVIRSSSRSKAREGLSFLSAVTTNFRRATSAEYYLSARELRPSPVVAPGTLRSTPAVIRCSLDAHKLNIKNAATANATITTSFFITFPCTKAEWLARH